MGPNWVAMPLLKRGGQKAACHTLMSWIVTPQVTSSHCTPVGEFDFAAHVWMRQGNAGVTWMYIHVRGVLGHHRKNSWIKSLSLSRVRRP